MLDILPTQKDAVQNLGRFTLDTTIGLVFAGVASSTAAMELPVWLALLVSASAPVAALVAAATRSAVPGPVFAVTVVCVVGLLAGAVRRQVFSQAIAAAELATARQRAEVARHQAALLDERNRLGRELHDVLAHTLGALSIHLTAVDAQVRSGATGSQLAAVVDQGQRLVGQGLQEAREAVSALRSGRAPLPADLEQLCELHHASYRLVGEPRPLAAEKSLALYRVAQEALTNGARHAPRATAALAIEFDEHHVQVTVNNGAGLPDTGPLAHTGGGYGVTGMRERILLVGGTCQAGPSGEGWRVVAQVPA